MSYRVEELAEVANVGVDTIRYYQRRKLLAPPTRQGRIAVYNDTHLTRLREIHDLSERGFTLAQIRELSTGNASGLLADLAGRNAADPDLDRSELARRAEIPEFMIDVVVGAGLITPSGEGAEQRFSPDAVEMLAAARVLIASGVSFEELTALAMRHATHVEDVVDDSIELFKRHSDHQGGDRDELVGLLARLVPVASGLVARHFEQTLVSRALARLTDDTAIGGGTIVVGRRLAKRLDPVAVFAASSEHHRALWIRPEFDLSLVALGAVETITPIGDGRFSAASAARAALAARTQRVGPRDAPAPVLVGGFSFTCAEQSAAPPPEGQTASPDWSGFPDARWVLPAITVVDRTDGTWLLAAAKVGDGEDEARATAALDERLDVFAEDLPAPLTSPFEVAAGEVAADDQHYLSRIGDALEAIADDEFRKVVLARIHEEAVVDPIDVLHRLRHRYQNCAVFSIAVGNRQFLGASPEQLVSLDGPEVRTEAVAGTISTTSSTVEADESQADESLAAELMTSPKIRAEHKFVVDDIIGRLEVLGLQGMYNPEPEIMRLARVQHLRTPISAQVQRRAGGVSDMDVLRVASVLHPTPAVAGTPTETAVGWILEREGFDRGWYAAPVGWCDLDGNGELCVALRSALVNDSAAVLFSGAGVVAESVPSDELAETGAKLRALLDVMETSSGC
ncbi:MAG: isochorismate synthase [Acidimicrobiaceae bacterium]|nr:isochorismate synthase [Acidimicrobiaceae bacterium]